VGTLVVADFDADAWAQWWPQLQAALPGEPLARWGRDPLGAADIDVALVANPPPGSLRDLPNLRLIQSLWAGVDRLLDDPSVPAGVPLARMVDPQMNAAMAETVHWAVLGVHRGYLDCIQAQRERQWRAVPVRRCDELQVAVLGMGQMGRAAARRLVASGYRVRGWHRAQVPEEALAGVEVDCGAAALERLCARSHVVVNLLPLTPATRALFDAAAFARMRPGASFVNLARGAHVVDRDLIAALDCGQLRHAVLDVFATEPLASDHPYWAHPAVTVLPHIAAPTDPRSASAIAARNIQALRAGRPLQHLVDRARGY
jgi:glyoxylate/hydroxypyruvate reductase A